MRILIILSMGMIMLFVSPAFSYPKVHIKNNTHFAGQGNVLYLGCSQDHYKIAPWGSWTGPYRGGCLILEISFKYQVSNGIYFHSRHYISEGSVWAYFAINKTSDGELEVKHSP